MYNWGLTDIMVFLGIGQGIFLAITLQFIKNKNTEANRILSVVLFIVTLMLLGRMFYYRYGTSAFFARLAVFVDVVILLFGPLSYQYVRTLVFPSSKFKISIFHFIPAFLHLSFVLWTYTKPLSVLEEMTHAGFIGYIYFATETVGLLSNLIYLALSFRVLQKFDKDVAHNISYLPTIATFLTLYLIGISLFIVAWLCSYINIYFLRLRFYGVDYNLIWVVIPLFIYVVGFYSLVHPCLLYTSDAADD